MGRIKLLKGRNLNGMSDYLDEDIYPITYVGAVYTSDGLTLENMLGNIQTSIESSASSVPIVYLWAYTNATTDSEALNKLSRNLATDIPRNYYSNTGAITLDSGEKIYMTSARKLGGTYLRWDTENDNYIWSVPIALGDNTTSSTGSDSGALNFIYCRTTGSAPSSPQFGVSDVENLPVGYGLDFRGRVSLATYNVWYDHPLGVTETYTHEYVCIAKKENSSWGTYEGPYLWSLYGRAGRDGDGVEFIFKRVAADDPAPQLSLPYIGTVGGDTVTVSSVSDPSYQEDDFIPQGWSDNPLDLTSESPIQYVSMRKKEWAQVEGESLWGAFSSPTIWAKITDFGYFISTDNDSVILDNDTPSTSLKNISYTPIHIWEGNTDIINDNRYYIEIMVTPEITDTTPSNIFNVEVVNSVTNNVVSTVTINDLTYIANHGFSFVYAVDAYKRLIDGEYKMALCLSRQVNSGKLLEGNFTLRYTAFIYKRTGSNTRGDLIAEVSKTLTVMVIDINDGTGYSLVVTPNTLPISREDTESPYLFNGTSTHADVDVQALKFDGLKEVSYCPIVYGRSNLLSEEEGSLYIKATPYVTQELPLPISNIAYLGQSQNGLVLRLQGLASGCKYYIVELAMLHSVGGVLTEFIIDSETIDLSIKGDNGQGSYVMSMSNDGAILDDLTVNAASLEIATLNTLTVLCGTTNVTSSCTFGVTSSALPVGLSVSHSNNVFKLIPNLNIGSTLPAGDYSYSVTASIDGSAVATKTFTFIVRDLTADGTVFKLNIENDTWLYDGDSGTLLNNSSSYKSKLTVASITNGTGTLQSFTATTATPSTGTDLVVKYPSGITVSSASSSTLSKEVTPSSSFIVNGVDLKLYYKGVLVDSEHIDCIKNGATGPASTVQGLRGAVIRNRGKWRVGNVYCCNTDADGNTAPSDGIVYIDVVYYNNEYYQCAQHHTGAANKAPASAGNQYWTPADNFEFIATKVLVAESSAIEVLNGGDIVVHDDLDNIVGGMTGGTASNSNDVIIWAGGSSPSSSSTKFKVYEDGSVISKDPIIYYKVKNLNDLPVGTIDSGDVRYYNSITGYHYDVNMQLYPAETFMYTPIGGESMTIDLSGVTDSYGLELGIFYAPPATRDNTASLYVLGNFMKPEDVLVTSYKILVPVGVYIKLKCLPTTNLSTSGAWRVIIGENSVSYSNS